MYTEPSMKEPLYPSSRQSSDRARKVGVGSFGLRPADTGVLSDKRDKFGSNGSNQSTAAGSIMSNQSSDTEAGYTLQERLPPVKETRGWKYFIKHTMRIPCVLILGIIIGAVLVTSILIGCGIVVLRDRSPTTYISPATPTAVPDTYMRSLSFNNSCLLKHLNIPEGPQTFDACAFVIQSTDEVWNIRNSSQATEAAIEKYFYDDYLDVGSWGRRIVGKTDLRAAIFSEMRAFPDIRIHITDCVCKGNDNDGYKCAMPDVLTGTNLGPSGYGPATGRFARWTGLVESFVKYNPEVQSWQYYAEWGVHDEWSLIQQLGLDFSKVPHPAVNNEPLHDCEPLLTIGSQQPLDTYDSRY